MVTTLIRAPRIWDVCNWVIATGKSVPSHAIAMREIMCSPDFVWVMTEACSWPCYMEPGSVAPMARCVRRKDRLTPGVMAAVPDITPESCVYQYAVTATKPLYYWGPSGWYTANGNRIKDMVAAESATRRHFQARLLEMRQYHRNMYDFGDAAQRSRANSQLRIIDDVINRI